MVRKIKVSSGIGSASLLIQHSQLFLKDIYIDKPCVFYIHQGHKIVHHNSYDTLVGPGELLVVSCGQSLETTNYPSESGIFSCAMLTWDPALLDEARQLFIAIEPALAVVDSLHVISHMPYAFKSSFEETHQFLMSSSGLPPLIARHRMIEQLIWLSHLGIRFACPRDDSITQNVRALLVNQLHRSFTAAEVAEQLQMNEVTLRRRLAAENTVLRNLIIDVRMTFALQLLQCTDLAISSIAQQVGYESGSRFAERFRKRFGFAPTAIRGHLRQA
ncbi:MAG: helix-turn-helix transcriptional regulator [Rouxiella aceris]|uniref:helix-turn-helix transcriptional regulator n=1 Tax=Rouxiella aceris TaxID=2703884 RepID=UPI00284B99BA|nr:helix-turn-helix transcriptional regulator [Rouxiella aceris]MDR3434441.1 helix-turn-helix transcriptional regulator [Rouxiella aceris]